MNPAAIVLGLLALLFLRPAPQPQLVLIDYIPANEVVS